MSKYHHDAEVGNFSLERIYLAFFYYYLLLPLVSSFLILIKNRKKTCFYFARSTAVGLLSVDGQINVQMLAPVVECRRVGVADANFEADRF